MSPSSRRHRTRQRPTGSCARRAHSVPMDRDRSSRLRSCPNPHHGSCRCPGWPTRPAPRPSAPRHSPLRSGAGRFAVEGNAIFLAIEARHRTSHPERDQAVVRRRLAAQSQRRARDRLSRSQRSRPRRSPSAPRHAAVEPGAQSGRNVPGSQRGRVRPLEPARPHGDRRRWVWHPCAAGRIAHRMSDHTRREPRTARHGCAITHRVDHLFGHRAPKRSSHALGMAPLFSMVPTAVEVEMSIAAPGLPSSFSTRAWAISSVTVSPSSSTLSSKRWTPSSWLVCPETISKNPLNGS